MQILKSSIIGYCHGVRKTLENTQCALKKAKENNLPCYSIGKLIHNSDVVRYFEKQGLKVLDSPDVEPGIAVIRAHGISDNLRKAFEEKGFMLVDSTCININATKRAILKAAHNNYPVVVIGVHNHAETNTLMGTGEGKKYLVSDDGDLAALFMSEKEDSHLVVATQTTFPSALYEELKNKIEEHYCQVDIANNLCPSCLSRKKKALTLAEECDAMVVVGGKNSSNTAELASWINDNTGKPVFLVENEDDFTPQLDEDIAKYDKVGVCSGTSTPLNRIDDVCNHLQNL